MNYDYQIKIKKSMIKIPHVSSENFIVVENQLVQKLFVL